MDETKRMPLSLYGLSAENLGKALDIQKAYESRQIHRWLVRGASSFEEMTDLSKAERQRLSVLMPKLCSSTVQTTSSDEGATKCVIHLYDDRLIECVVLTDKRGHRTACLSSQVGCAMGCAFCRTGKMGLFVTSPPKKSSSSSSTSPKADRFHISYSWGWENRWPISLPCSDRFIISTIPTGSASATVG